MRMKTIPACLAVLAVVSALLLMGCQEAAAPPETPPDTFTTTWNLGEEERAFGISGDRTGHKAGVPSEFELMLDNLQGDGSWQGEYCVLLLDRYGVVEKVAHRQYDVPAGLKTSETITVHFPEDFEGPLGLCVVVPERASVVSTLWVGADSTGDAGPWPNIATCP